MKKIELKSIPHNKQRYCTAGDWQELKSKHLITVSDMDNENYEWLVAVHELIEYLLCLDRGITDKTVTDFDKMIVKFNEDNNKDLEPGDEEDAPYYHEHQFASKIEKMLAKELKVNWNKYNKAFDYLDYGHSKKDN